MPKLEVFKKLSTLNEVPNISPIFDTNHATINPQTKKKKKTCSYKIKLKRSVQLYVHNDEFPS